MQGTPSPVPAWTPASDEDRKLAEYAQQVMALSKGIEDTVARYRPADAAPRLSDEGVALLASRDDRVSIGEGGHAPR